MASPSSKGAVDTAFLNDQRVSWIASKVETLLFNRAKFKEAVSRTNPSTGISGITALKEYIEEGAAGAAIYFYLIDHSSETDEDGNPSKKGTLPYFAAGALAPDVAHFDKVVYFTKQLDGKLDVSGQVLVDAMQKNLIYGVVDMSFLIDLKLLLKNVYQPMFAGQTKASQVKDAAGAEGEGEGGEGEEGGAAEEGKCLILCAGLPYWPRPILADKYHHIVEVL